MFIVESELFRNLSQNALEVVRNHGTEKDCKSHDLIFREGEDAEHFYVLAQGSVHLIMGEEEELCFVVDRPGEMFGWSALIEPNRYRATARCTSASRLIVIPRSAVDEVERDYPRDAIIFFKNLSAIVTEKLREAYQERVSDADLEGIASFNEGLQRLR